MTAGDEPVRGGRDPGSPREGNLDPAFAQALGRAIKVLRTGLARSRRELAAAAGLSYSYLSEIENGRKAASAWAQQAIAQALGISVSGLMAAAEDWAERIRAEEELAARQFVPAMSALEAGAEMGAAESRFPEEVAELGARDRQRRWFHASAHPTAERFLLRRTAADEPSEAERGLSSVEHLKRFYLRLKPEDRVRVLDLARRLAETS